MVVVAGCLEEVEEREMVNIYIYIYIYCKVPISGGSLTVNVSEPKPNKPNTMNLVEKRA